MPQIRLSLCLTAFVLLGTVAIGAAQELRVHTITFDASQSAERPAVIARSLTVFHAGKVYDLISESGEVTIYEPVQRRFTLLQVNSGTASEVSQDQIRHYLSLAEEKAQVQVLELSRQPGNTPPGALQLLQFQLRPKFEITNDAAGKFRLSSPRCRYEVKGLKPPEAAVATAYLKYADAVAELNSVLNPHAMLPGPRLQVNQELRARGLVPGVVRRQVDTDRNVDLRVEHDWKWKLEDHDRQMIALWETTLAKSDLRRIPFEQLQREVLSGKVTQK